MSVVTFRGRPKSRGFGRCAQRGRSALVAPRREETIAELLTAIPELERRARELQANPAQPVDAGEIQACRQQYLEWYARCLTVVPDNLQAEFKDFYQGGTFVRRVRQYLEAPTEVNVFAKDPSTAANPLVSYWANPFETTFAPSLLGQQPVLQQSLQAAQVSRSPEAADLVEQIGRRLPLVIRELGRRREGRVVMAIQDEYDVQDLVRTILVAVFEDVRPEEWTPSYAGGSSRMDFLLKVEGVVVETKFARVGGQKQIRDELAVDLLRYQAHPDCQILVCVVYDPDGQIRNPRGFEQDLTGPQGNIALKVAVVQG